MNMVGDVRARVLVVKVRFRSESGHRNMSRASRPSQVRRPYVNCAKPAETSGTSTKTNSNFLWIWSHCHKV